MARVNTIIQSKVPAFITVFGKLQRAHGGIDAACKAAGIHITTYYRMTKSHFLTDETARRILAASQSLKARA